MFLKTLITIILFGLSFLNIGCPTFSVGKNEVSSSQIQRLKEQIKSGQFAQIYRESAETLQAEMSQVEFVGRVGEAVRKMKSVDETLTFQESEFNRIFSSFPDSEFWKDHWVNLQNGDRKAVVLMQWSREDKDASFKFRTLCVIESSKFDKQIAYCVDQ